MARSVTPVRSFVAIEIPDAVKARLSELVTTFRQTRAQASWVRPERMHLTLRFLGDIADDDLVALEDGIAAACAGIAPFTLTVSGVGVFPNLRRPGVVWAGVGPLEGPLAALQEGVESAARGIGAKRERKPFRPHLTLARVRDPRGVGELVRAVEGAADFDAGQFPVGGVTLFSSTLTGEGSIYAKLREFPFA